MATYLLVDDSRNNGNLLYVLATGASLSDLQQNSTTGSCSGNPQAWPKANQTGDTIHYTCTDVQNDFDATVYLAP